MASEEMIPSRRQRYNRQQPRNHNRATSRYLNNEAGESEWGPSGSSMAAEELKKQELRAALLASNHSSEPNRFKRRSSSSPEPEALSSRVENEDVLVYVHVVQPTDTLARVLLIYDIDPGALRRANRLWPNDNIQVRSQLYIPVSDCAVKGVPISVHGDQSKPVPQSNRFIEGSIPWKPNTQDTRSATTAVTLAASEGHHSFIHIEPVGVVEIIRLARPKLSHFPPASTDHSVPRPLSSDFEETNNSRGDNTVKDSFESLEVVGAAIETFVRKIAASARTSWVNKTTNDLIELTSHIGRRSHTTDDKGNNIGRIRNINTYHGDGDASIPSATTNSMALNNSGLDMPRNRRLAKQAGVSER
ncbi:hypothetical protein H072_1106 [Dactylellina haptotyla CBS 200.50]|uniref:LysM domain-containing protein n=1 Tax=Dactylellina haptotyla (strain CBS 200.50) TaxID=1284197 RepID=S8APM8_DACHA|nr:hypothetical protein H072_1106 [Dactylellina haptotyla CBS 200.50]